MKNQAEITISQRLQTVKISQIVGAGIKCAVQEGISQLWVEVVAPVNQGKSLVADVILGELEDGRDPYRVPSRKGFSLEGEDFESAGWKLIRTSFNSAGQLLNFGYTTMPFSSFDYDNIENSPKPYDSFGDHIIQSIEYISQSNTDRTPEVVLFGHKRRRSYELNPYEETEFNPDKYDFIDMTIEMGDVWTISLDSNRAKSSEPLQAMIKHIRDITKFREIRHSTLAW